MELQHHWRTEKILTLEEAAKKSAELRAQGKTIVSHNGSYDLLHGGHLDMLEEAKQQGDILFVGINTDTSIRNAKGPTRPIIPVDNRAAMLAALICVDYVTVMDGAYNEEPQGSFIPAIKPHVHVNGEEYGPEEKWIEYGAMQACGAKGHSVPRRPNLSTSDIIKKIQSEV